MGNQLGHYCCVRRARGSFLRVSASRVDIGFRDPAEIRQVRGQDKLAAIQALDLEVCTDKVEEIYSIMKLGIGSRPSVTRVAATK